MGNNFYNSTDASIKPKRLYHVTDWKEYKTVGYARGIALMFGLLLKLSVTGTINLQSVKLALLQLILEPLS